MTTVLLIWLGGSLLGIYALWVFYLAVMNLKRVQDSGKLTKTAYALGLPILVLGLAIDALVNTLVMTVVLFEPPKELTVTARLKRHNRESTGWRKDVARWFEPILDPFDPSGDHI